MTPDGKPSTNMRQRHQIFVGGCPKDVTEDVVNRHFSKFGDIEEIEMKMDKIKNTFRGFCFVTFCTPDALEKALEQPLQKLAGGDIQVKKAMSEEESRRKLLDEKSRKLFLVNLSQKLDKDSILDYFKQFGEIESVKVIEEKKKAKEKRFGFVLFKMKDDLEAFLEISEPHVINNIEVDCKKMLLRDELKDIQKKKSDGTKEKNLEKKRRKRREKKKRRRMRKKLEKQKQKEKEKSQEGSKSGEGEGSQSDKDRSKSRPASSKSPIPQPKQEQEQEQEVYISVFENPTVEKKEEKQDNDNAHSADLFQKASGNTIDYKSKSNLSILSNPFKEEIQLRESLKRSTSNFFNSDFSTDFNPTLATNPAKINRKRSVYQSMIQPSYQQPEPQNPFLWDNRRQFRTSNVRIGNHNFLNIHQSPTVEAQKSKELPFARLFRSPFDDLNEPENLMPYQDNQSHHSNSTYSVYSNFGNIYPQKKDEEIQQLYQNMSNLNYKDLIKSGPKLGDDPQLVMSVLEVEGEKAKVETRERSNATLAKEDVADITKEDVQAVVGESPLKGFGYHRNIASKTKSEIQQNCRFSALSKKTKKWKSSIEPDVLIPEISGQNSCHAKLKNDTDSLKLSEIAGLKDIIEEDPLKSQREKQAERIVEGQGILKLPSFGNPGVLGSADDDQLLQREDRLLTMGDLPTNHF